MSFVKPGTGSYPITNQVDQRKAVLRLTDAHFFQNIGLEKEYNHSEKPALMTVYANSGRFDKSNVDFTGGVLNRYQKGINATEMTHIDYGLNCFDKLIFSDYPLDLPLDLAEICTDLATNNQLAGYEVFERFYEIGSHQGILDFTAYIEGNLSEL